MATSAPVPIATPRSAWRERRRVVDAVADHRHASARGLQALDVRRLVGRARPRPRRDRRRCPTWRGDGLGRRRPSPVTSQTSMPAAVERRDRRRRVGLTGSPSAMSPSGAAVDGDERDASGRPSAASAAAARARRTSTPRSATRRRAARRGRRAPSRRARSPRRRRRRRVEPGRRPERRARPRAPGPRSPPPSGCSLPRSTRRGEVAAARAADDPARRSRSPTTGRPSVSVPVLSNTTDRHPVGGLERLAAADEDAGLGARGRCRP